MQFFHNLETAESRCKGLWKKKPQSIDELLESTKFEKFKGSNIAKCVKKKYFSYIIDKFLFV